jgi:hypothetical protein
MPTAVPKKTLLRGARPRNDNQLQPGEPLECLVRERGSPIWIPNQGANMAPLYPVTGSRGVAAAPFTVNIPTTASGPQPEMEVKHAETGP